MRKFLFLCFLLSCTTDLFCQYLNVARHSYIDDVHGLVTINNKHFYMERIISNANSDSTNLVGMNETGQIIFKKTFKFTEVNLPVKIIKTLDNSVLVLGLSISCDIANGGTNFIYKVDTNGIVKFQTIPQFSVNGSIDLFRDVLQYPDSSYYFLSDSLLYHYSKTGTFISSMANGLVYASTMALTNNGNFIVHGNSGNFTVKNIEITTGGTVINQQNATESLRTIEQTQSGSFFGLTYNNTVQKLNANLASLGSTSLTITNTIAITAIAIKNDSIFFAGTKSSNNNPIYGILDQSLNLQLLAPSGYKNIFPVAITVNAQNKVSIISRATSSLSPYNSFISYYQSPQSASFVSANLDIGVESFTTVNTTYSLNSNYVNYDMNVRFKNYTNDTIRNFCLNAEGRQLICGIAIFHKLYHAIIPPLGSVVVQTGSFDVPVLDPVTQTPGFVFSHQVCLFTTVPNQQNDIEINNDHACATFSMAVGIGEKSLSAFYLNIFPNPISNHLNLESDAEIKKIEIYNACGQLTGAFAVKSKTFAFDCSNLENGIYLLKVETEKGVQIKKVVKD